MTSPLPTEPATAPAVPPAATGGLLAVHAHPDDETLSTGGLLATWAADGRPVTLVTCTRGERGEVIPPALAALEGDGPALAAHRAAELAEALARLGVTDHVYLDAVPPPDGTAPARRFEDSGMAWVATGRAAAADVVPDGAFVAVGVDDAAARLARVLRDRRPDVVVTYEPAGGYGHPDHVHAHRVTARAVELAARPGPAGEPPHAVAAVLWAAVPDVVLRAAAAGLVDLPVARDARAARPGLTLPDGAGPLPSVAVDPAAVDVRVETATVLDRVVGALRAHGTQVGSVAVAPTVPLALAPPARTVVGTVAGTVVGTVVGTAATAGVRLAGCYALSNDVLAPLLDAEWYRFAPGSPRRTVSWPAAVRPVA